MASEKKTFPVQKESLSDVQEFVSLWAENNDIGMKISTKLSICADEVVSNVVFYSGATELEITCSKEDGMVTMSLRDNGKAFNPLTEVKEPDTTASAEEREIGGLGIFMVKKMMNSVSYERVQESNVLTMTIAI